MITDTNAATGTVTIITENHNSRRSLSCFFMTLFTLSFAQPCLCAPNILLILTDDLNTRISTYGDPLAKTPNIDKLAKRGIRFDRAYANYPQCMASRASFLTGLYPGQNGVFRLHHRFRSTVPNVRTLPQVLKESGYHTTAVGKIFHFDVPSGIGSPDIDGGRFSCEGVSGVGELSPPSSNHGCSALPPPPPHPANNMETAVANINFFIIAP